MYRSDHARAMAGIYQQIPSFGFGAADDGVAAAEKVQVNCFLDHRFRARSGGNGLFETMKALVVKKNFQSHD
jgi:hypothetical protein